MELIPVIALRFFLLFTMLPESVQSFTVSSNDLGLQEWHRKGDAWVVEDKEGRILFTVTKTGNEVQVVTTERYGTDYCKDATAYITAPAQKRDVDRFVFEVRSGLGSPVTVLRNQGGLAFFQDGERFLFREPVIVIFKK